MFVGSSGSSGCEDFDDLRNMCNIYEYNESFRFDIVW